MRTYVSLTDVNYTVRASNSADCCGACKYLDTGGNAITCTRIEPPARVIPQGICDLFEPVLANLFEQLRSDLPEFEQLKRDDDEYKQRHGRDDDK